MTKKLVLTGFAAVLLFTPAAAMAQHIDVGPGGVRARGNDHHRERRVIERHHDHDADHTGTVRVEREHHHHDDHHDDD